MSDPSGIPVGAPSGAPAPGAPLAASTGPAPAAGGERRMSSLTRIFAAFYSPGATFEDIARAPHFLLCWLVTIVVAFGYGWALVHRLGAMNLAQQALALRASAQPVPPAQMATVVRIISLEFYAAPIGILIGFLVIAAIFLGVENFILGQSTKYKSMLAVVSHASLPLVLLSLLSIVVLYLRADAASLNFQYLIGSSLAYYVDPQSFSKAMMGLMSHLDVFSFWTMGLLALGMTKLGKKLSYSSALISVIVLWLVFVLGGYGLALI